MKDNRTRALVVVLILLAVAVVVAAVNEGLRPSPVPSVSSFEREVAAWARQFDGQSCGAAYADHARWNHHEWPRVKAWLSENTTC